MPRPSSLPSRVALAVTGLVFAGLLAGCGDDADTASPAGVGDATGCAVGDVSGSYLYEIHGDVESTDGFTPFYEVGLLAADGEGGVTRTGTNSTNLTETVDELTLEVGEDCQGTLTQADGNSFRVLLSPGGEEFTFFPAGSGDVQTYLDGGATRVSDETDPQCDDEVLAGTYQYRARGVIGGDPLIEHGFEVYDGAGAVSNTFLVAGEDAAQQQTGTVSFQDGCHAVVEYETGQTLDQYVSPDGAEFYWIQTAGFSAPGLFAGHEHRVSTAVDTALTP